MISIVIPLFNKAPYIGRALESVMAQTYSDWECIIVDDGSTDGGLEVVSEFTSPRLKMICQDNAGPSAARNRGAKEASGEWIALLDADDYWLPDHLSTLVDLSKRYPDCGVVATNVWCEDREGHRVLLNRFRSDDDSSAHEYIEFVAAGFGALVHSSAVAIRNATWETVGGFRCEFRLAEDADFWCRLSLETKFAVSHRPTAVYFQDTSGRSTRTCLYVGDAPFVDLRETMPSTLEARFEKYLARWRVNSLALGTLLSGRKRLVRRMLMESMPHFVSGKSVALLMASFLPTRVCSSLYTLYRQATRRPSEPGLCPVSQEGATNRAVD